MSLSSSLEDIFFKTLESCIRFICKSKTGKVYCKLFLLNINCKKGVSKLVFTENGQICILYSSNKFRGNNTRSFDNIKSSKYLYEVFVFSCFMVFAFIVGG